MDRAQIEAVVLQAIQRMNEVREWYIQIPESLDARLDVRGGPLDSLDLMTLLLEAEEGPHDAGSEFVLAELETLLEEPYPLASGANLVDYIERLVKWETDNERQETPRG
jgi:acyl carrier protein